MKKQTILLMFSSLIAVIILSCSDSGSSSSSGNNNGGSSQEQSEETKTEWTQWLDKYESLVERNNALQSRVKSGDMTATQEIVSISQEMMEVAQKCQENQSLMSPSEVKRMIEIMQKIQY